MKTQEEAQKTADKAKVAEVADHIEGMMASCNSYDLPWLERAAKLLRRWGIDLS